MEKYKNSSTPIQERVDDLFERMTLHEKIRQLDMFFGCEMMDERGGVVKSTVAPKGAHIDPQKFNSMIGENNCGFIHDLYPDPALANEFQKYVIENTRLGIPVIFIEEALRGLCKPDCTTFPAQPALAATFRPELSYQTGRVIATETRATGVTGVLGPTMDLTLDPRWGRVEESYGEDTFLSAVMAQQMVLGLQGDGIEKPDAVMAEPKHFAAHGAPQGGLNCGPAMIGGRRGLYTSVLPVFEAAVKDAGAYNVMCSYNSIDGIPCASDHELLTDVLRGLWDMQGVVITDLGASMRTQTIHRTAETEADAITASWNAGVDVQFYDFQHDVFLQAMEESYLNGKLEKAALERAVKSVLKLKFLLGLFENPYVDESLFEKVNRCEEHLSAAEQVTRESMTLLKNNGILPLKKDVGTIAVVGACAKTPYFGAYAPAQSPEDIITAFDGIESLSKGKVLYAKAALTREDDLSVIPDAWLQGKNGEAGFQAKYYMSDDLTQKPVLERNDVHMSFNWVASKPSDKLPDNGYTVVWEGQLCPDIDFGGWIGFTGNDKIDVWVDDKEFLHVEYQESRDYRVSQICLEKGKTYKIKIVYRKMGQGHDIMMGYSSGGENEKNEGLRVAREADVVIAVMGDSKRTCSEGFDRDRVELPGKQREFLMALKELGKPVILVLQTGRPVALEWESENVDAIINQFCPDIRGGKVLAQAIFGIDNPAGRLAVSFPRTTGNIPCHYNRLPGAAGSYLGTVAGPLYAFGHGLSYTDFAYTNLQYAMNETGVAVSVDVENTGAYDGDEVVQIYVKDVVSSVVTPEKSLKAFKRVHIKKEEKITVDLFVPYKWLALIDKDFKRVAEKGEFILMAGASSEDIRLTESFVLQENHTFPL